MSVQGQAPAHAANGKRRAERAPKAAEAVVRELRRRIVYGELGSDGNLPTEGKLVEMFGVSRTPIREAMRILELEGWISLGQGGRKGARVLQPTVKNASRQTAVMLRQRQASVADVYQARVFLEPHAAKLVAQRASKADVKKLNELLAIERACVGDPRAWGLAAASFHSAVIDLSGNQTLAVLLAQLDDIVEAQSEAEMSEGGGSLASERNLADNAHAKLISLVESGKGKEAERFWRLHLEEAWPAYRVTESLRIDELLL
jgi:DNA-binding FadR family transcriptional regulator